MKKLLITGASGYIGSYLYSTLKDSYEVYGTSNTNRLFPQLRTIDLTNSEEVSKLVKDIKPDVIIHCAALASRKPCEENPELAKAINLNATKYLLNEAEKLNTDFIFCSSLATINPNNTGVYAQTKRDAEKVVATYKNSIILRLSVAFGVSPYKKENKLFNQILKNISDKTDAEYSSDWTFNMTYLGHIKEIVEKVIEDKSLRDITLPVATTDTTTIYQIAKDILSKYDLEVKELSEGNKMPPEDIDFSILEEYNLPQYSYQKAINSISKNIKRAIG